MTFTTREFTDRRRPRWVLPTVITAAVVVVALVLVVLVGGNDTSPTAAPAPATATAAPTTGGAITPTAAAATTRDPSDPDYLTALPAGLTFRPVHGLQLPFSTVDGPLNIKEPIAAGYSRTPQGAAIATTQLGLRLLYAPGYQEVAEQQTALTPDVLSAFIAARDATAQSTDAELAAAAPRPVGFKVTSFTPDSATVELVTPNVNGAAGTFISSPYTMVWQNNDWRAADNSNAATTVLTSLAGFTSW